MEILVCIKQVPESNKVEVDPVTGVLNRSSAASKMNPYDLYALETALRLRQELGGRVSVMICAMILPPKAGRICTRSVFFSIFSTVQSAVRPVCSRAATRGAS